MKFIIKLFIIPLLIACPTLAVAADSFPSFPMAFWGTATLNGQPLLANIKIQAYCATNLIGEVVMQENGIYGYADSSKMKLLVSDCNQNIVFKYSPNGASEIQYAEGFVAGKTVNKDLNFTTTQTNTGGGGGGGGGGGSSSPIPNTQTTLATGDINNDGKINIFDFSVMMEQWGQTGSELSTDLNNDGKVDIFDFSILMANWNS